MTQEMPHSEHKLTAALQETHLTLNDYLQAIHKTIDQIFDHEVWVHAEIRAINTKSGHYYFELAQKDDNDHIIASCRATLWRYRANALLKKFTQGTGNTLQTGMSVLFKCSATFHAHYGFSLNISDINPIYTLGELAKTYHATLKRLQQEGLTTLNKSLPTPFDIEHVIVISPQHAAGLGDFQAEADRLSDTNACQFYYHHATFQGNHAPDEIRQTIVYAMTDFVDTFGRLPDLLVIIRGGGAVGDLAYLNNYELAALVANQPVPVWVGIGHEKDIGLLDEVAHTCFDTPSKVIAGIEHHLIHISALAKTAMHRLTHNSQKLLDIAKQLSTAQKHRLQRATLHALSTAQKDCQFTKHRLITHASFTLSKARYHLDAHYANTKHYAFGHLATASTQTIHLWQSHKTLFSKLNNLKHHCQHLQSLVLFAHPKRMLAQGYTLTYHHNQLLSSTANLQTGDTLMIQFNDGKAYVNVQDVVQ